MEHSCSTHGRLILFTFFRGLVLLLCMNTHLDAAILPGNETDRLPLLDFKDRITQDPLNVMSSWNDSTDFCRWVGVTCNPSTKRVTILKLNSQELAGSIPASIGNLTYLTGINLANNDFHGEIPQEMGRLRSLQYLNLSANSFRGKLPANISHCTKLSVLNVRFNELIGSIPNEFSSLLKLTSVLLSRNNLTGSIPKWMGNFSALYSISLLGNNFHGSIPNELGRLKGLQTLTLSENNLSANDFTGTILASFGNLKNLVRLNLAGNLLGSGKTGDLNFLSSLANCTILEVLGISNNQFGGELPRSIANLSTSLQILAVGGSLIHGSIPIGIGNLIGLTVLAADNSFLSGNLPDEIGKFHKLGELYLSGCMFSGRIPSSLGNMTSLTKVYMDRNRFEGSIPPTLANCQILLSLNLSSNNITGAIPRELIGLSSLSIYLGLANNRLTGALPQEVGNLAHLVELDASGNQLSGNIPSALGNCIMLVRLCLADNKFEGTIPQSLKSLRSLEEMDISSNNFSGQIPEFIGKLKFLKNLNVSNNIFEGELPKEGIFLNASGLSILGNGGLCGGIPQLSLPPCSNSKVHSSRGLLAPKVVIPVACALAFIIALSCFIVARSRRKHVTSPSHKDWKMGVSYSELVKSTNGFSMDNLIGMGSFGSVYKGIIPSDGTVVAVKILNLQQEGASRSFIRECNALRSIRHRNLLKIITACSSIDNQGNDFKSLVFEYMVNGSLDAWLHPIEQSQSKRLSLIQRLNIATDIASALDYLHHHCDTSIVHCDLKPSNVLLDEDMVAHVADFGLARFLLEVVDNPSQSQTMSVGLKGSIGYIPPEYGMGGKVSILGDVYSFGILLLEMFTGKRPTDRMFGDGINIHNFIALAMPDHAMDIIQERPITNRHDRGRVQGRKLEECLVSVMQIGLACSAISPGERMHMNVVVNKMKAIRDSFMKL
ncbi:LRR receptor-like serine/threonine-protein kinase [Pyrus ussuriensis x Pyrus communis]|uniref:non-specific serine/threonine protein kinase n=1 Tax=Pyrus ussuriensis x Pyrus communis TaxID=2448454 RepID=A0A5N5H2S9_9ROSA|nr:LRR receptor-like serine/threonine-protein kinase [Pyrus ussuriensis x Pyrus communis]